MGKMGKGQKYETGSLIAVGNEVYRTRTDSISRNSLRKYTKRNEVKNTGTKCDWICVCKKQNYERNSHCRWCSD